MKKKEVDEFKEKGMLKYTVIRLYKGALEFREDQGTRAKDAKKALKVEVQAEDYDYQIISLKELEEYKKEDLIAKNLGGKYKDPFNLYRFKWRPVQEKGRTITVIEKDRTWQYVG